MQAPMLGRVYPQTLWREEGLVPIPLGHAGDSRISQLFRPLPLCRLAIPTFSESHTSRQERTPKDWECRLGPIGTAC